MKIEVVEVRPSYGESCTVAYCDIKFNDDNIVKGFKIVEGKNGLFVAMPSKRNKKGKWVNTFKPPSKEVKDLITDYAMASYEDWISDRYKM